MDLYAILNRIALKLEYIDERLEAIDAKLTCDVESKAIKVDNERLEKKARRYSA